MVMRPSRGTTTFCPSSKTNVSVAMQECFFECWTRASNAEDTR
jgi:hypothetical protein